MSGWDGCGGGYGPGEVGWGQRLGSNYIVQLFEAKKYKNKKWEIKEKHLFNDFFLLKLFCS